MATSLEEGSTKSLGSFDGVSSCEVEVDDPETWISTTLTTTTGHLPVPTEDDEERTLSEFYASIPTPSPGIAPWYKAILSFIGPGALVAVGYMDPGNWSTDIAGGSAFGYKLLFVILISSLMAMFLQSLALKLGVVTGKDLAQICRDQFPKPVSVMLWAVMEIAICSTGQF
jgi:hypothetical protein